MPARLPSRLLSLALLAAALVNCGGSPSGPPPPPPASIRFTPSVATPPPTSVTLRQATLTTTTIGVDVVATDLANVASVFFDIVFNPTILQFDGATIGPFLGSAGASSQLTLPTGSTLAAANAAGRIPVSANILPAITGVSGSGVVVTLNFHSVASGGSNLSFENRNVLMPFPGQPVLNVTWGTGSVSVVR